MSDKEHPAREKQQAAPAARRAILERRAQLLTVALAGAGIVAVGTEACVCLSAPACLSPPVVTPDGGSAPPEEGGGPAGPPLQPCLSPVLADAGPPPQPCLSPVLADAGPPPQPCLSRQTRPGPCLSPPAPTVCLEAPSKGGR